VTSCRSGLRSYFVNPSEALERGGGTFRCDFYRWAADKRVLLV
jgi:hypothetical protein